MKMKLTDYLAFFLKEQGIRHIFELSGGMITHILDSVSQKTDIKLISVHHEQAAAFAADAYGRVTGLPGIAMATSGPGATNLLTGIGSCYFDSVPAIFITGQVNIHELRGDRPIRQLGFQETDIVPMAKPITKAAIQVLNADEFPDILEKAFRLAISGRPGPVLLDLPMNIQRQQIEVPSLAKIAPSPSALDCDFASLFAQIQNAKRPLILAGGGIRAGNAHAEFLKCVEQLKIPVCTSLLGVDVLPFSHPLRVGFFGSYGNRWSNQAIADADLLIVLGARLDIRQTGADVAFFNNRKIIHVDCEAGELHNRVKPSMAIQAELLPFLKAFNDYLKSVPKLDLADWLQTIRSNQAKMPDTTELKLQDQKNINPNIFMHSLSRANRDFSYTVDVGAHQMWAAQSVEISAGQRFLNSGGMGAMGYSLPAAIGGCLASASPYVVIVGDGSLQLNIQELQTIARNNLPIKIIVMDNRCLGMIRQFQDSYFEGRHQSTVWGYSAPDFAKIAMAYGIESKSISLSTEVEAALAWCFSTEMRSQPCLLHVNLEPSASVYPKIAFGKPLHQMEPLFAPDDMEGT